MRGLIEGGVGIALLEIVRRLSTTQVEIGRHARAEGRAPDVVADVDRSPDATAAGLGHQPSFQRAILAPRYLLSS